MNLDAVKFDADGLVPVVVRDTVTGGVAMLAFANREALEKTLASRQATFWSRSRKAIWIKGETSGNRMEVLSVAADCDGDAVLYEARLSGPACHTGEQTCFHEPLGESAADPPGEFRPGPALRRLEAAAPGAPGRVLLGEALREGARPHPEEDRRGSRRGHRRHEEPGRRGPGRRGGGPSLPPLGRDDRARACRPGPSTRRSRGDESRDPPRAGARGIPLPRVGETRRAGRPRLPLRRADAGHALSTDAPLGQGVFPSGERRGGRSDRPLHVSGVRAGGAAHDPRRSRRGRARRIAPGGARRRAQGALRGSRSARASNRDPDLPPLSGGAVGYLSYDAVRLFEAIPDRHPREGEIPDGLFLLFDAVVAFDHPRQRLLLLTNIGVGRAAEKEKEVDAAIRRLDRLETLLWEEPAAPGRRAGPDARNRRRRPRRPRRVGINSDFAPLLPREEFLEAVRRAKEAILAGDIYQVVLSQRWTGPLDVDPFDVYRALRMLNPSPYLFYLETREAAIFGASPEMLVRCRGRRRGDPPDRRHRRPGRDGRRGPRAGRAAARRPEGARRARHARRSRPATIWGASARSARCQVPRYASVEKYSHVQHLVSEVRGTLAEGRPPCDALAACFPAGTLTGAPKIRAMEIIDDARSGAARRVRRRRRLPRRRRQPRHGDRDPHGRRRAGPLPDPGRRRDRGRLDSGEGVSRGRVEGRGPLPRHRDRPRVGPIGSQSKIENRKSAP